MCLHTKSYGQICGYHEKSNILKTVNPEFLNKRLRDFSDTFFDSLLESIFLLSTHTNFDKTPPLKKEVV